MSFMKPEVVRGDWYEVEDKRGETSIVPTDVGLADWIDDLKDGESVTITLHVDTWGGRMSAPGYLDCTEWGLYKSEADAIRWLREEYETDDEEATRLEAASSGLESGSLGREVDRFNALPMQRL